MLKRKTCSMVRSLVALLLVVMMVVSCGSMSASASTAYAEPREYYWEQCSDPCYISMYDVIVANFRYTDATKICSLMANLDLVFYLRYDVFRLDEWNSIGYMPYSCCNGQKIASYLSKTTLKRIENLDAEHAITVIKTTKEYRQSAALRRAVNNYLYDTLDTTRVRAALSTLYPQLSDAISRWNISALVNFANSIMKSQKYQRLQKIVDQLHGKTNSVEEFAKSTTEAKQSEYWTELSAAISGYGNWAQYIQTLNQLTVTLPIGTYSNSAPMEDEDEPVDAIGSEFSPNSGSVLPPDEVTENFQKVEAPVFW